LKSEKSERCKGGNYSRCALNAGKDARGPSGGRELQIEN